MIRINKVRKIKLCSSMYQLYITYQTSPPITTRAYYPGRALTCCYSHHELTAAAASKLLLFCFGFPALSLSLLVGFCLCCCIVLFCLSHLREAPHRFLINIYLSPKKTVQLFHTNLRHSFINFNHSQHTVIHIPNYPTTPPTQPSPIIK